MFTSIDWKQILLGLVSLVAAALWTELVTLEPPFESVTFTNILLWLVELILGGNAVQKFATLKLKK